MVKNGEIICAFPPIFSIFEVFFACFVMESSSIELSKLKNAVIMQFLPLFRGLEAKIRIICREEILAHIWMVGKKFGPPWTLYTRANNIHTTHSIKEIYQNILLILTLSCFHSYDGSDSCLLPHSAPSWIIRWPKICRFLIAR